MNTKKLSLLLVILLTLIFVGAGCGNSSPTTSTEGDTQRTPSQEKDSGEIADTQNNNNDDFDAEEQDDDEMILGDAYIDEIDLPGDEYEGWKIYEQDGITLKYPENWRVSEDGILYRWREGLEEEFASQDYFEYLTRMAETSIGVSVYDNEENLTLEDMWNEVISDYTIKENILIDGEPALTANCSGINYAECVVLLHDGKQIYIHIDYMIDDEFVRSEVRQILETIEFE